MKWAITLALFSLTLDAHASGPPSIQANQDGVKSYNKEDYVGAFRGFAKALGKDSHNPAFHYNLGNAFLKNGEVPKALSEYEATEKSANANNELKYKAMFNAGNAEIGAKNIPKALEYYQQALNYKPGDKETKTNIELALKEDKGGGGNSKDQDNKDQDKKPDDKQDKKDKKDPNEKPDDKKGQDKKQPDQKPDPKEGQGPKPTPKPFSSQNLNEGDVRRILEELKRQEEQIRAKQNTHESNVPERQIEKDW